MRPDFFVVGAAKAGTTAVHHALSRHDAVYLPRQKETNYFALFGEPPRFTGPLDEQTINRFSVWRQEDYERLFRLAPSGTLTGEVCPMYLYSDTAPANIAETAPNARIVVFLREPLSRAISAYRQLVRDGRETESFARAVDLEPERIQAGWEWFWHLASVGMYADQVARYLNAFGRDRVRIFLYDELVERPNEVLDDMQRFLGLPVRDRLSLGTHNRAGVPRPGSRSVHRWLYRPSRLNTVLRAVLPEPLRRAASTGFKRLILSKPTDELEVPRDLNERFLDDVVRLERIIERDLSRWRDRLEQV